MSLIRKLQTVKNGKNEHQNIVKTLQLYNAMNAFHMADQEHQSNERD